MTTLTGAPLRRIDVDRGKVRMESWPFTIPTVRELVENGFEPAPGLTVFIGENGSGKSTLVEAIAPRGRGTSAPIAAMSRWRRLRGHRMRTQTLIARSACSALEAAGGEVSF